MIGVDVVEIGIEVAEIAGVLSAEVSAVIGPAGIVITAVVILGTQIYAVVKTSQQSIS